MPPLPSLNALRAFEATARHGRLKPAAEELSVTEGAVSHQVRALERDLGLALFLRQRQRLSLTAEGERLAAVLREAFGRIAEETGRLRESGECGVLTVSVSPNFAAKWLAPRLVRFARLQPEIELRLCVLQQHVDFARDAVDVAVRHGDGNWPDLYAVKLYEEELFPVCNPVFLRDQRAEVEALEPTLLLRQGGRDDWRPWLDATGRQDKRPAGPALDLDFMAIDAAAAGQGLAMARTALVAGDLLSGRLVRLFRRSIPAPFAYWVVAPPAFARRPKVRAFRDWLFAEATAETAALAAAGGGYAAEVGQAPAAAVGKKRSR